MDEYDRYLIKKTFTRFMFRIFFFGFVITLFFMTVVGGPRRVMVNEFGQPVDIHGRPIDRYGSPIVYQNYPPIYDPFNLGGVPKNSYPSQNMYGRQYAAGTPGAASQPQGPNSQNYY